ncbi:MAG: hypothetical protein M1830_004396 [Pleopsidium flavum]|nr:MAG: hypothetical protein M1830_004396 [Pleopsidium flavum]
MSRFFEGARRIPGFLAWQSAHRSLPGTVLISSCIARSFRAWERLLIVADMFWHEARGEHLKERGCSAAIMRSDPVPQSHKQALQKRDEELETRKDSGTKYSGSGKERGEDDAW